MSVFRVANINDVLTASGRFLRTLTVRLCDEWDRIAPPSSCRELAQIPQLLADASPDSPRLWLWCSTTSRLLGYFDGTVGLPELAMVSRPDFLDANDERLADLHRFGALEVLIDHAVSQLRADDTTCFSFHCSLIPPRSISLGSLGSVIWDTSEAHFLVMCDSGRIRIESGTTHLEVSSAGEVINKSGNVMFRRGVCAQLGGIAIEIPIHDPTLTSPTWQDFPILMSVGDGQTMLDGLKCAYGWLERFDKSVAEKCAALTRAVMPVRCGRAGRFGSASREEAVGLTFLPQTAAVDLLAESMLHEAWHQMLFRIDRTAPVLSQEDRVERFYSPWRQDARPLDMVLHGAFVFAGVAALYAKCARENWPEIDRQDALERSYRRARQVEGALATVRRHGHLSYSGETVSRAIETEIHPILRDIPTCGLGPSTVASIDSELSAHASRFSGYVV